MFEGRIVYQGEPIPVESGQVAFELWQPGFGKNGQIDVSIDQDGNFSSLLFDGNYKLIFAANQGPFYWKRNSAGAVDTIAVNISGNKTMDIEVTPYYMIRNAQISNNEKVVTATFSIEKIITDANARNIERVSLYINKTQFVSGNGTQNIAKKDLAAGDIVNMNSISLSATIPDIVPIQNYVFARIGLKIAGADDMIFSPLQKLTY
ncbi:DUF3823 domain-containing protein [Niabella ginsengisoli]|uniref:DUF3823 domain-containing protein n=1 Tax=Niabella ginsengisoli TaxID=522298 RepID=A0ABS9SFJ8_9BACT|nr:DUF3823 domain-containing protein [Niabella ginsengisoli]MCH5597138.1 DUF3823 domain-containing protein [Niabella ginsengisoli]